MSPRSSLGCGGARLDRAGKMLDRSPKPARQARRRERRREQQRRRRQREAANLTWVGTTFTPEETAKLRRLELLGEHQLEDPRAIANAVHQLIVNVNVDEL